MLPVNQPALSFVELGNVVSVMGTALADTNNLFHFTVVAFK
jgi:hypothetical protein